MENKCIFIILKYMQFITISTENKVIHASTGLRNAKWNLSLHQYTKDICIYHK